jgi:hypothetical protein
MWYTGSGNVIEYEQIVTLVKEHSRNNGSVFIGTDSFLKSDSCVFSTAICLHGADGQRGGRYFIRRNKLKSGHIPLAARMTEEVHRSVEAGMKLVEQGVNVRIEIHIDVSGPNASAATSKYSDMLTGYAKGAGFDAKVKPNSWASSAIADKHSK